MQCYTLVNIFCQPKNSPQFLNFIVGSISSVGFEQQTSSSNSVPLLKSTLWTFNRGGIQIEALQALPFSFFDFSFPKVKMKNLKSVNVKN